MQNSILLDEHLFGRRYITPCVVLAVHAIRNRIAGVSLSGKRHYKFNSDTMWSLVEYVLDGNTLETHDDVPPVIRQQLYVQVADALDECDDLFIELRCHSQLLLSLGLPPLVV
jgi:hypothetical protein